MHTLDQSIAAFKDANGLVLAHLDNGIFQVDQLCSASCCLADFANQKPQLIPLGSTRPEVPGFRFGQELLVNNVFTHSKRARFIAVHRSFQEYTMVLQNLKENPLPELVKVHNLCLCSTVMEFLEEYQLLDTSSKYSPAQHQESWSNQHPLSDFLQVLQKVLSAAQRLHAQGILHTDLTGFNIFVSPEGDIKILDLFSCIPFSAVGKPGWSAALKKRAGLLLEWKQIRRYLIAPAERHWKTKIKIDPRNYEVVSK